VTSSSATLYFEDFAPGDRWALPPFVLEAEGIVEFSKTWDPMPYHTDPEVARASQFGGLVASGIHTLAAIVRRQHEILFHRTAAAAGEGLDAVRFHAPVRAGEAVHGEVEVLSTSTRPGGRPWGRVVFALRLFDSAGARLFTAENRVLVWDRSTAAAADRVGDAAA
jgi:acyl dehydratase